MTVLRGTSVIIGFAACVSGAPTCRGPAPSFNSCGQDLSPGIACAHYCSARLDCAGDRADLMTDCLFECGDGFVGAEALRFAAAESCLASAAIDAECAVLQDCIQDPVELDCGGWCDALNACEEAPEECALTCEEDLLSQVRSVQQSECLAAGPQCADIDECIGGGGPIAAPDISLEAFCQVWNGCGFNQFGPCEDFFADRMPDEMKACLISELSACPNDPFLAFELCDAGEGGSVNPQAFLACAELCEADAFSSRSGDQSTRMHRDVLQHHDAALRKISYASAAF